MDFVCCLRSQCVETSLTLAAASTARGGLVWTWSAAENQNSCEMDAKRNQVALRSRESCTELQARGSRVTGDMLFYGYNR